MSKFILLSTLLFFTLITNAQTILSDQVSLSTGIYEKIDFFDEDNNSIVSLAPKFYRESESKLWIKPIKINNQNYFIKRKTRNGVQSVYTNSGKHVANIESNGAKIHLVEDGSIYILKPTLKSGNFNILKCSDKNGILVSTVSMNGERRLVCENSNDLIHNLLLLSLCTHQYQELLLGDRGKLSAYNSAQLFNLTAGN